MYKITATQIAIDNAKQQILKRGSETKGIRIGLRAGGCVGFYLIMEFVDKPEKTDHIYTFDTVSFYIDPKSIIYLNNTEIDYEMTLMKRGFKFNIPSRANSCSCGESFSLKEK